MTVTAPLEPMTEYRVEAKCWGETSFALFGRVAFEFKAGVVKPKNEQEEACLEHLVEIGMAARVTGETDAAE